VILKMRNKQDGNYEKDTDETEVESSVERSLSTMNTKDEYKMWKGQDMGLEA